MRQFVEDWNAEHATVVARDLSAPPRVEDVDDAGTVEVVFDGRLANKMWKDWMVLLLIELRRSIEAVEFIGFNDRGSGRLRSDSAS